METNPVTEYLKLSRSASRAYGNRKRLLDARMQRLYDSMTTDQRAVLNARWRDPR